MLRTLTEVVWRERVVDHTGAVSGWAWQLAKALCTSEKLDLGRFVSVQSHYNLAYREEEREIISALPIRRAVRESVEPLGRGFLTGKYRRGEQPMGIRYEKDRLLGARYFKPEDFDMVERPGEIAKEKGATLPQVAVAWPLSKQGVTSPEVG